MGQTVGDIGAIDDDYSGCNYPHYDGSRVYLYLDLEGEEVTETEWTG